MTTSAYTPHERRVGDIVTTYDAYLKRNDDTGTEVAFNLTGYTVKFTMINAATGVAKVSLAAATVVTAATGHVRFTFAANQVDKGGVFWTTFRAEAAGAYNSFPVEPHEGVIWIHSATATAEEEFKRETDRFPSTLDIGASYTTDAGTAITLYLRDKGNTLITSVGSNLFTDGDFAPELVISQSDGASRVKATVTYVDPGGGGEVYLRIQMAPSETRRAAPGIATMQCVLKWTGVKRVLLTQPVTWIPEI